MKEDRFYKAYGMIPICKVLKIKLNQSRLLEIKIAVIHVGWVLTGVLAKVVFHNVLIIKMCYFINIHQAELEFGSFLMFVFCKTYL